jgi:hypothetical protein
MLLRKSSAALAAGLMACGARSDAESPSEAIRLDPTDLISPDDPPCLSDRDCIVHDLCVPRACVDERCVDLEPIVCDDGDPCTEDTCGPEVGTCTFRLLVRDEDGDGFFGPRPGFLPGEPGSCGDDCDDTNPGAYPGGIERCDGADNDCNGIVDDAAVYLPTGEEPVLLPYDARQSAVGGLAFTGVLYAASFSAQRDAWQSTLELLTGAGTSEVSDIPVARVNADTFGGPIIWTGSQLGTAWEDRRDGNFEIYFNRFDATGNKLGPDVRVTNADDFSLRPSLIWDGTTFVVVWGDRRNGGDDYRIYGQRIGPDGALLGENIELTPRGYYAESPSIAQGGRAFGVSFNVEDGDRRRVAFRTVSVDLQSLGDIVMVGSPGSVSGSVVWSQDRYIVAYSTRDVTPGPSILASAVDEDGNVIVAERPITGPAPFARGHSMLPLGDRLVIVWAEEQSGRYDLYTKQVSLDLEELSAPERITSSASDTTSPAIAFGPDGDVGLLYQDLRSGAWQVYFTRLTCRPGAEAP